MSRQLWTFPGGLHLADHKAISNGVAIESLPIPAQLVLPLHQHIGTEAKPIVQVGERVLKGQMIAQADGYVSAPVHAPTSGTISAIEEQPVPHPSGLSAPCIVIDTDGQDEWCEREPVDNYTGMDPSHLRNIVRDAGIVGLGGAGFPAFIKLNPGPRTVVDTLILNGAECEPYITCDDRLMREQPETVIEGARIMRHALQAKHCVIGIEDNKPEAATALREALQHMGISDIEVVTVPTLYPTGGEKQLIKVLTGKEVPAQGLPIDIGIVCHNVSTAASIYKAVQQGEPLITRVVTVTGKGIAQPRNVEALLGTPMAQLIEHCGGKTAQAGRLLMGGPLMGFTLNSEALPVIKTTNCLLALGQDELAEQSTTMPCIRCGECARVCPVLLLPQQLYWHARAKNFDKTQDYNLFDCIECGCCAYVCPSNLPLVQYYRYAKTEIWSQEREKKKSDLARQRHDFRQERQAKEKAEREERMRKKKAALQKNKKSGGADDAKKAAIKAAMERAKAKREQAKPQNTENLTEEQQRKINEVDARRAKVAQQDSSEDKSPAGKPDDAG